MVEGGRRVMRGQKRHLLTRSELDYTSTEMQRLQRERWKREEKNKTEVVRHRKVKEELNGERRN